ncbi:hypothetical protein [Massilia brevitalea]|uniref:hypothetical protein n=1 Tax=Massilia brevitalea TaxID=442526 RepID=UPI00273A16CD|nr:hypothetical protein [Massilia brevitalea]
MKERPILFSAPMVRALLDGSKMQTRRVVKLPHANPLGQWEPTTWGGANGGRTEAGATVPEQGAIWHTRTGDTLTCPYGQPGDRLWVRETWGVISNAWDDDGNLIDWIPDRPATAITEMPFGQGYYSGHVIYAADGGYEWAGDDDGGGEPRSAWKPSIHMPRAASRILLEVVSVRVERLQDCSKKDAIAEGIHRYEHFWRDAEYPLEDVAYEPMKGWPTRYSCPVQAYQALWESINGAGSWDANPWVWVVEFKRVAP